MYMSINSYYLVYADGVPAGPSPIRFPQTFHGEFPPREGSWANHDDCAE